MAKKKKINDNLPIVITGIALACLLAVMLLYAWLNRPGPLDKLETAGKNTLLADNFTVQCTLDVNGETIDSTINAAIDQEKRQVDVYLLATTKQADYMGGIYNNTFLLMQQTSEDIYTLDITDRVEQFFVLLEENGQPDWSVLLDFSDTNLHETLSQDFDFDTFTDCLGEFLNDLNNTGWAKKYAGYSKEKHNGITTYSYQPELYTLVCEAVPMFRSAFRDPARYDALNNYIDDAKYLLQDGTADFSFSIKQNNLVGMAFHLQYFNTDVAGNFSFTGIGTTTVDTSALAMCLEQTTQ